MSGFKFEFSGSSAILEHESNGENGEKAVSSSMPVGLEGQAWSMVYS